MRIHWLFASVLLALVLLLALTEHDAGAKQPPPELLALRDSIGRLNDLEDRTFALLQLDNTYGSMPLVGTLREVDALAQEARQAAMRGCASQARDALVSVMEEIAQGGYEAWSKAERYVNAATACDSLLAEQEKRWMAGPG